MCQDYRSFSSLYRVPSILSFGEHWSISEWGVQQRDPLETVGFCITINPLVKPPECPLNLLVSG